MFKNILQKEGVVKIDGVDVKNIPLKQLKENKKKMIKIKNLKIYRLDDNGFFENYCNNDSVTIKRGYYCLNSNKNRYYKIYSCNKIITTDILKIDVSKYNAYLLRESNNNGEEIIVCLNYFQNIIFKIINYNYYNLFKNIFIFFKSIFKCI